MNTKNSTNGLVEVAALDQSAVNGGGFFKKIGQAIKEWAENYEVCDGDGYGAC